MANGVHTSQKRSVRNNSSENKKEKEQVITDARYIHDFSIAVTFTSGKTKLVNFLPLFERYVKGDNLKYFAPERFKKFIVKDGNIHWGRYEDVIFPVSVLFQQNLSQKKSEEEILYII